MYVLLSGRSPFLSNRNAKDDTAMQIMKRIRSGDLKMDSDKVQISVSVFNGTGYSDRVYGYLTQIALLLVKYVHVRTR